MYQSTSFRKKLLEISNSREISFKDIDTSWVIQALDIPFTKLGTGSSCLYITLTYILGKSTALVILALIYFTSFFFLVSFFTICFTSGLTALSNSGVLAATKPITAVDTIVETSGMY